MDAEATKYLGAAISIAVGAIGPGIGIGLLGPGKNHGGHRT
ncbi:MAG: hypothetical protein CM1200mP39_21090 [Dehalococcoidia bacterium]|nr:MAG: hypothetical protein CM1200mP39_21090 [Dehalococcoidia bacterium]